MKKPARVLIAYRSRYGATEACARKLAERLGGETVIHDLRTRPAPDVRAFDAVLVGGSIYAGKIQREVGAFCERQREALSAVPVGLFICCLFEGEKAREELNAAFPPWLAAHAFAREVLGGELRVEKLSRIDRFLAKSAIRPLRDISGIREDVLEALVKAVTAL